MDDNEYNYLQHDFSVPIYLDEKGFHTEVYKTEIQSTDFWVDITSSSVLYDTELDCVINLSEGSNSEFSDNNIRRMDNFLHHLSDLYHKDDWNDEDILTFKIIGKALEHFVNEAQKDAMKNKKMTITFNCHYLFVLHFGCMQADFEERIIRPLFIQANLITSNDHPSRLQVFTELEYLVQNMRSNPGLYQFTNYRIFNACRDFYKKKDRYIISKLDMTIQDESYWSCHPFEFVETIKFDGQNSTTFQSTLVPRSIQGLPAAEKKLKIGIKVMADALSDLLQSEHEVDMENIMTLIIDYFYPKKILDRYISNNDNKKSNNNDEAKLDIQLLDYYNNSISKNNSFRTTQEMLLSTEQQMLIKNVSMLDIYNKLLAPIQRHIKKHIEVFAASSGTFRNNVNKLYVMFMRKSDTWQGTWFDTWVERWAIRVLLHYEKSINYILVIEMDSNEEYEKEDNNDGDDNKDEEDKEGQYNSVTDSGSNNSHKISQNFSYGGVYYGAYEVLKYAWEQLIHKIQIYNVATPPYFVSSQQQVILSPEKITNINSRSAEKLLPILQEKFHVNLELKAYYLQVQLHQECIQFTLNQVVKIASDEEDAASFVVEDRIIAIESIYDSFCKKIFSCRGLLDDELCNIHNQQAAKCNNNGEQQKALATNVLHDTKKDNYKEASASLKEHFNEIIRLTTDVGLGFDVVKRMVKANSVCDCRLSMSMLDFIEVALIPTITEITAVISGALVNKQAFGRYNINHVFLLLGDLFKEDKNDASPSAFMIKILANTLQGALEDVNDEKEIQPSCFYCIDTIKSLDIQAQQRQKKNTSRSSFGSSSPFNGGGKQTICPVLSETYDFCLSSRDGKQDLFQQVDGTTDKLECTTNAIHSPIIIVEKGQHIPIEGIQKVFYFKSLGNNYYHIEIYKKQTPHLQNHSLSGDFSHDLGDSRELIYKETFLVEENNHIGNRFSSSTNDLLMPIYFSIKYKHPESLLKISILNGEIDVYPYGDTIDIGHPLTLAYF